MQNKILAIIFFVPVVIVRCFADAALAARYALHTEWCALKRILRS